MGKLSEVDETIRMWEDLILLEAFQIVHGPVNGYLRFRYLRFGVPETEPLPQGVDFSRIMAAPTVRRAPTDLPNRRGKNRENNTE